MHPAALPDDELLKACTITRGRRGGPGGQHRNKVETAIRITHEPTGVNAEASERRSQKDNQKVAVFRLRMKLAIEVRLRWQERSPLWSSRTGGGRIAVNPEHTDTPTLLAESLDAAAFHDWDDRHTADALGVTRSQLIKWWRNFPPALQVINQQRESLGHSPLR